MVVSIVLVLGGLWPLESFLRNDRTATNEVCSAICIAVICPCCFYCGLDTESMGRGRKITSLGCLQILNSPLLLLLD